MSSAAKRALDVFGATTGLVVLSPLLVVVAILVRWRLGGPVLFHQRRPGYLGREFQLLKFRTMTDAKDSEGRPLGDGQRLTTLGSFLRRTSIDELPELWNVLRGQMSLVGPRPLLSEYLPRYSARQSQRHNVRPGLTGWAQVRGRNSLTWDQKFELDLWYVEHWSIRRDLQILALTIATVAMRRGINEPGEATARPFSGSTDPGLRRGNE